MASTVESACERGVDTVSEPTAVGDLVSVVIPVYNVGPYLRECLWSVGAQSYLSTEIIVVDDGSTDASGEICDRFAANDGRCVVIHQRNGGLSLARNVGLEASHGRFVTFVDGDDYLAREFLTELVRAARRTRASVVASGCTFVTENGQYMGRMTPPTARLMPGRRAFLEHLRAPTIVSTSACGKLFERSLFADHQLEFPVGRLYEDNYLTPRVYYYARSVAWEVTCGYMYRQRDSSISAAPLDARSIRDWTGASEALNDWLVAEGIGRLQLLECYRAALRLAALNAAARRGTTGSKELTELLAAVRASRRRVLMMGAAPLRTRLMLAASVLGFPVYRRVIQLTSRLGLGVQRPARTRLRKG
ncbi:MAG: glycosyltransferase [Bifidobacteriaceae bacterium]|jgi:glycosyltransferase involved in cell wall biosynthesis|nr:glycosyltransferase [Bifidobacteriaceae bacterium]